MATPRAQLLLNGCSSKAEPTADLETATYDGNWTTSTAPTAKAAELTNTCCTLHLLSPAAAEPAEELAMLHTTAAPDARCIRFEAVNR
jgi:hypothetical protein